jgi:hypothetical protein
MLSVHLYRYSQLKLDRAQDRQIIRADKRNQLHVKQGPQLSRNEEKITGEEEVIMIPVEDVIRISYKSEIKKDGQTAVKSATTPVYRISENCCDRCCARLFSHCCCCCSDERRIAPAAGETTTVIIPDDANRNAHVIEEHLPLPQHDEGWCSTFFNRFRCWCCRKRMLVDLIKRKDVSMEKQAQRIVTISIEYSKYSNPGSVSTARLLSRQEQEAYYKERFEPDTKLEFYLINDAEFDPSNFELKQQQAEGLCRTVMHLKAMTGNYPFENELGSILDQPLQRTYGDPYIEPKLQLPSNRQTQLPPASLVQAGEIEVLHV